MCVGGFTYLGVRSTDIAGTAGDVVLVAVDSPPGDVWAVDLATEHCETPVPVGRAAAPGVCVSTLARAPSPAALAASAKGAFWVSELERPSE